jgi:putative heme-binding domain-containing protein
MLQPLAATIGGQLDAAQLVSTLKVVQHASAVVQSAVLAGLNEGISSSHRKTDASSEGESKYSFAESADIWRVLKSLLPSQSPSVRRLAVELATQLRLHDKPEILAIFETARLDALNAAGTLAHREQAMQLLAHAEFETVAATAAELLDARQPPAMQQAALEALSQSDDARAGAALLEDWESLTPNTRDAVLKMIFARANRLPALLAALQQRTIRRGELSAIQREQLVSSLDPQIADLARKLLDAGAPNTELARRIHEYQQALAGERDFGGGKQVFAKSCLPCHKLGKEGFEVGPPLGSVLRKPDEAILMDLLDPSGHIESEYASYIVVTNQGRSFTGILTSESATSVTLLQEKGVTNVILRQDIDIIKASATSLMPANLHEQLSPADTANLIAFLRKEFASRSASGK